MKKTKISRETLNFFLLIFIIFVLGEIVGIFLIRFFFIRMETVDFKMLANNFAEQYVAKGNIEHNNDLVVKVFDEDNNLIWTKEKKLSYEKDAVFSYDNLKSLTNRYNAMVFKENVVCNLERLKGLKEETVMIAVPVYSKGKVTAALYLFHSASSYSSSLYGFITIFSISLLLSVMTIYHYHIKFIKKSKEVDETRRKYVANISHELKSPISSIKAITETLADGLVTDEAELSRYYGVILSESNRLEKLVADILELSRLQTNVISFKKEIVSAEDFSKETIERYSLLCEDLDISFEVDDSFLSLKSLMTDRERAAQVLNILINNAVKFSEEGGTIRLYAEDGRDSARICVKDNGAGMSEEMQKHIFERFYKSDDAKNSSGTGLGLAIAYEIITGLGGKIGVRSEEGAGTCIWFTVPHYII